MKKLIFILALLIYSGNLFAAGITSIEGPSSPCANKPLSYTVNYLMVYNPPYYTEVAYRVTWEFIQNGVVVYSKTKSASSAAQFGLSKLDVPGLPNGAIEIKVKLEFMVINSGFAVPSYTTKKKSIYVGIPDAATINGNAICPTSQGSFSIAALSNATSYTWEVPAGWKVNGITGPTVTNQGAAVTIKPCSDSSCAPQPLRYFVIRVKGVSTACGTGNYTSKTITIDYPVNITETNLGDNDVRLNATPTNFPSYQWSLDPAWFFPANGNKNLPEISFYSRGITGLAKLMYKTPCQNTYTREWWWVLPNTGGPGSPGTPGEPEDPIPGGCEPEIPVAYLTTAKSSSLIYLRDPCGEELPSAALYEFGSLKRVMLTRSNDGYEFDISNLKAGAYIMRVRTASGKHKTVKFIKRG